MPELPEVETIKRQLEKKLPGKKIEKVQIIDCPNADKRIRALSGIKILKVRRRAKTLIVDLNNDKSLLIHLKLTGQLIFRKNAGKERFTRVLFYLSSGGLLFNDMRKFGFIKLVPTENVEKEIHEKYGPEPFDKDFTLKIFEEILVRKKKSKIKPLLMDQKVISGLGNIYAQEACFIAGIKPGRTAGSLDKKEQTRLYSAIKKVLLSAIKFHGTSFDSIYVDAYGQPGGFGQRLYVYQQEKCKRCGQTLKSLRLGGRGTWYCGRCQN